MNTYIKKILLILSLIFIIWYISTYWIQLVFIQGDSMSPTYSNWQLALINKHSTYFDYGDIIVFKNDTLNTTMIKRIIALPNDTIQIINGTVYVNNKPSTLISTDTYITYAGIASGTIQLSNDEFFVLGDNYEMSKDSRYEEVGFVKYDTILGKILEY